MHQYTVLVWKLVKRFFFFNYVEKSTTCVKPPNKKKIQSSVFICKCFQFQSFQLDRCFLLVWFMHNDESQIYFLWLPVTTVRLYPFLNPPTPSLTDTSAPSDVKAPVPELQKSFPGRHDGRVRVEAKRRSETAERSESHHRPYALWLRPKRRRRGHGCHTYTAAAARSRSDRLQVLRPLTDL